ncbi:Discoidin domain-containing receptor 2 [Orchesella cincta]|uniref:Tyrosine-protein kinase receptor n=1 Tax=Orchesella cincta TaxID=48709 RepID=A0A1D2N0X5_ORCCI|nr:Discoidin domain-containing receptor 2 [Orchesella cincta]
MKKKEIYCLGKAIKVNGVRMELQGGAWCPRNMITSETEEWLQIDLHNVHLITATETQGRFGNGQGQEYAEFYKISYWRPELNNWIRYRDHTGNEVMKGNINTYLAEKSELNPPIYASKLRIIPFSRHRRTVCMRSEVYGCIYKGGLVSYSMPQGSMRGENWNFYDHTYDGIWDGNHLQNGLGSLADGRVGPNNFKDDFYTHERGKGWVGWKNDTSKNGSESVEIIFKFTSPQEFFAMHIHTSNQFTKEVQVFSEARVFFSANGKVFSGDSIVVKQKEDCIFEEPRNITIKLHRRVAQYIKLQLFWAAKWILISEVTFDARPVGSQRVVHSGISTTSSEDGSLAQSDASGSGASNTLSRETPPMAGPPALSHSKWSPATIIITAVISSVLAIIIILTILLTVILVRRRVLGSRKVPKTPEGTLPFDNSNDFGYASPDEIRKYKISTSDYTEPFTTAPVAAAPPPLTTFPRSSFNPSTTGGDSGVGSKRMADYYICTLIPNATQPTVADSSNEYEYAVPNELGKLLPSQQPSPLKSIPNSPATANRTRMMLLKFKELGIPEIQKHRLRMLRKLGDGTFGSVFVGELDQSGIAEKQLVAVKHLLRNATDKDKSDFLEEVRLLWTLRDPNIVQVLGIYVEEDPLSVVLEFLELGDLCQFLRQNDTLLPNSTKKISFGSLLHIASQISSGMKFLESRNIVHRDLAARNCVVGRGLLVKVSHFAKDTDLYATDYYRLDGKMPLPIRWMAWESLFLGKYSTKTDVFSFGILFWEILTYCRHSPYPTFSNQEVLNNLRRLSVVEDLDPFEPLSKPQSCPRDIYQLMCDTWSRNDDNRPTFWEINSFLSRKNLHFTTHGTISHESYKNSSHVLPTSSSLSGAEHYMV